MTATPDQFLAQRLGWVFRRSVSHGDHTMLFEDFPEAVRERFQAATALQGEEIAVVGYVDPRTQSMLLVTTRRLWLQGKPGDSRWIAHGDLAAADIDRATLQVTPTGKGATRLHIRLRTGELIPVATEGGPGSLALLNVICAVIQ